VTADFHGSGLRMRGGSREISVFSAISWLGMVLAAAIPVAAGNWHSVQRRASHSKAADLKLASPSDDIFGQQLFCFWTFQDVGCRPRRLSRMPAHRLKPVNGCSFVSVNGSQL
jgi:hypothetical protein